MNNISYKIIKMIGRNKNVLKIDLNLTYVCAWPCIYEGEIYPRWISFSKGSKRASFIDKLSDIRVWWRQSK